MRIQLKIAILGAICMLCAFWANAQQIDRRLRLGVGVGAEATTFINNPFNSLVSKINIPGFNVDLNLRLRIGKHWSVQLSPGYTIMPYRSHRIFVGDSLDENGSPAPFGGMLINRKIHCDLHQGRLALMGKFHFSNTQQGGFIGGGLELQGIRLSDFDITMTHDSTQVFHAGTEQFDMPLLAGAIVSGGYSWNLYNEYLFTLEPYVKYSPLFTKEAKILSWGTAGIKLGFWL